MNKKKIEMLREQYPKGTRICLNHMFDQYRPVPKGTLGTVDHVDDIGTIHMSWDNGQGLGLVEGEDDFTVIERSDQEEGLIRVIIVEPLEPPRVAVIKNTLEDMQEIVGGLIEEIDLDEEAVLVCNEEGKINNLKANRRVGNDVIAGTFFIAREDGSEYLRSLTDEQIKKYQERFQKLEEIPQEELVMRSGFVLRGFD